MLLRPIRDDVLDRAFILQRRDNVIALDIGIRIRGVRDLECEPGEGKSCVPGAGSDPDRWLVVGRAVGVAPEAGGPDGGFGALEAQRPKANVVALAWAIVDGLLEPDVLPASEEIEGAERRGRLG